MKKFSALVGAIFIASLLIVRIAPSSSANSSYFNSLDYGAPVAPQSIVPADLDVQIHQRAGSDSTFAMNAEHGVDCSAPPATHPISTLPESVFACKNHLMTAINGGDYGEVVLTPPALADWSSGTTSITFNVSTEQFNPSDWLEVWISPFAENTALPIISTDGGVDLQGPAKHSLAFSLNHSELFGTYEGDFAEFDNFAETDTLGSCHVSNQNCLSSFGLNSPVIRTPYEIDISSNHIRFGLPAISGGGVWWQDINIPTLPFTQGVVQFSHHSYNPEKHGTGVDTWHWSNFAISNAVPFTIINGVERSINPSGTSIVHFPIASPAGSFLRFSGIGPQGSTYTVSFDGGITWVRPTLQSVCSACNHDEHFSTYFMAMPTGVSSVQFRGVNWWGGDWWVRDPAIWSLNAGSSPSPTPTASPSPSPSPLPSPSPSPTPSPSPSPTPTPSPVANFGYTVAGSQVDSCDGGFINGSRFNSGSGGHVASISVHVSGPVDSSANQFQVAIYSDNNGRPASLMGHSISGTLLANSWNTLPVSVVVTANTNYWLVYETNTANCNDNNMSFVSGGTTAWSNPVAFGNWPASFGSSVLDNSKFSIYATYG